MHCVSRLMGSLFIPMFQLPYYYIITEQRQLIRMYWITVSYDKWKKVKSRKYLSVKKCNIASRIIEL
jgi:hypothetical protein